ncbi:MAG: response regulator transcription factor [Gammaproteobacteria bacterium]|nr:response regulator transcription factor [Gammaproteobacteria bacterium]
MRILIVEDELDLQRQLHDRLKSSGFVVDTAEDGEEGHYYGKEFDYEAAVIDLGLPRMGGIELIRRLRAEERRFPILILTARGHWQDKVEGLEAGADDYLTKPFQMEELQARLNALVRRAAGYASPVMTSGPIALDTAKKELRLHDEAVELTAYEYRVLEYLMLNPGRVVSKTELTDHLYEQDFERDSNVIEVFVGRLRKKLDPHNPIRTVRGQGYRFTEEGAG